jgi:hypothetical protein
MTISDKEKLSYERRLSHLSSEKDLIMLLMKLSKNNKFNFKKHDALICEKNNYIKYNENIR